MIALKIDVKNSRQVRNAFLDISQKFPDDVHAAYRRAGSIISRKIQSAVTKLGTKDTGKFAQLSEIRNAMRSDPPGGVLSRKGVCKVQRRGNSYYCGYVSGLSEVFSSWQDGQVVDLANPIIRHHIHKMLGSMQRKDVVIPYSGNQPNRNVIEPITKIASEKLADWVISVLNKRFIKKFGHQAISTSAKEKEDIES